KRWPGYHRQVNDNVTASRPADGGFRAKPNIAPRSVPPFRVTIDVLTHPRSAPVEIPSGPRVPPPGAGALPFLGNVARCRSDATLATPRPFRYGCPRALPPIQHKRQHQST